MSLSVIIPYVGEYPQNLFTILGVHFELDKSGIPYEIIAIDNWCEQAAEQTMWHTTCDCGKQMPFRRKHLWEHLYRQENVGGDRVDAYANMHTWLKSLHYTKKLSHWQAKNLGVANATGDILFFMDGHCLIPPGSLVRAYNEYTLNRDIQHGTLHLPVTYFLEKPGAALIYKLIYNPDKCEYDYRFTRYRPSDRPYKVPCMSTCGMLMRRDIYNDLGGWPEILGIYGGGEHFINFTLAVLGYDIHIMPVPAIHHYAEKRGYNYEYVDYKRNKIAATYIFGGEERAETFSKSCKLDEKTRVRVLEQVFSQCLEHRQMISAKQVMDIDTWARIWKPDKE